ncbi:MAG: hypothetical protein H6721_28790 [Sandaracinus sp.]|nr:hypothetical protein [Sandaracinus sp.]MCB9619179.1 hypothetical protein [Sandaracinus sp.]MCB9622753.1 hypothetical protein [Sandaracinus sp.]MCB9636127.1 hypothetical protein [Sandaracinus sp.]
MSQPPIERLTAFVRTHRRRLAFLVLAVGIVVVGGAIGDAMPRDVHLRYAFGPEHDALREAHVAFLLEDEEVQSARFARAGGFPDRMDHEVSLAPGRYRVEATLRTDASSRRVERALRVPTDGVVLLDLYEAHP